MKSVLLVLSVCVASFAGVAIKGVNVMSDEKQDVNIQLSDLGVKIDMKSAKIDQTIIFRNDKFLFWVIDNSRKSYMEFTKQDLDNIKKQLTMLQEKMKNMPKAQREMMEQMMGGAMPQDEKVEFKLSKKGSKSGKFKCNEYQELVDGKLRSTLCLTPIKKLGLTTDDFSSLKSLSVYMDDLAKQNKQAEMAKYFSEEILEQKGFPVNVKTVGPNQSEVTWESIKKTAISDSVFDLPTGLKQEKIGM